MTDEIKATATEAKTETPQAETVETLQVKLADAERKAQNKAEEAARHYKKLERFEAEEAKRKEADMTEVERYKAEIARRDAELDKLTKTNLRREAASKAGLPEAFTNRIQGETAEEMQQDAEELAKALPRPSTATVGMTQPAATTKLTREAIAKMTTAEINKNWDAVQQAMSQ